MFLLRIIEIYLFVKYLKFCLKNYFATDISCSKLFKTASASVKVFFIFYASYMFATAVDTTSRDIKSRVTHTSVFTFSHLVSRNNVYLDIKITNILRRLSYILFDGDGKGYVCVIIDVQFFFSIINNYTDLIIKHHYTNVTNE